MDCVLLLFQHRVDLIVPDPDRTCPKPSWTEALKLMSASNFLQGLLTFPKVRCSRMTAFTIFPLHCGNTLLIDPFSLNCGNIYFICQDTINEETVELMAPYLEMDDYSVDSAKRVCGDVAGLAAWTTAMAVFYSINREVLPLKVL